MWCRALLVAIALTCTFHREIFAEPDDQSTQRLNQIKDVICVLLMSGLQKEDLDLNLLNKLRRFNVNIDDINIGECVKKQLLSSTSLKPGENQSQPVEGIVPTTNDGVVQTNLTSAHDNFTKTTKSIEKSQKSNKNETILQIPYTRYEDANNSNVENFMKMPDNIKVPLEHETEVTGRKPITLNDDAKNDSQPKKLDDINKMFANYLASIHTTTIVPTSTPKKIIDDYSQKLKEFFDNNIDYKRYLTQQLSEFGKRRSAATSVPIKMDVEQSFTNKKYPTKNPNEPFGENAESNISSSLDIHSKVAPILTTSETLRPTVKHIEKTTAKPEFKPLPSITEVKLIPDNVIKEITEKIKASILKELQKEISPTTSEIPFQNTTENTNLMLKTYQEMINNATGVLLNLTQGFQDNIETQTDKYSSTTHLPFDRYSVQVVTTALEKFVELLKDMQGGVVMPSNSNYKNKIKQQKDITNEFHGPIHVSFPHLAPSKYVYAEQPVSVVPIYINLHQPEQTQQTHNNLEIRLHELPTVQSAHIIQTDAALVPVLGIPVPNSIQAINQNIIVTTKHPMDQIRDEFLHPPHPKWSMNHNDNTRSKEIRSDTEIGNRNTDTERNSESEREIMYRTDAERSFGDTYKQRHRFSVSRLSTKINRENKLKRASQNSNMYKKYTTNMQPQIRIQKVNSYPPIPRRERTKERYHKKFEKPKQHSTVTREEKRLKVVPRQQLSLTDLGNKASLSDSHFRSFLKSQQKVNQMLEAILASKGPEGVSGETTVNFFAIP